MIFQSTCRDNIDSPEATGIATDGKGSMYLSTGNGYSNQLAGIPVPGRQPPTALEEAAVNFKINDDGSLTVVDFFMPWEKQQLDGADKGKSIISSAV